MTAISYRPVTPLYPVTSGGWPCCGACFQHADDLANSIDPRDRVLKPLCRTCHQRLAAGLAPLTPTGDELADTWERLALLLHNREIGADVIDAALTELAPHLEEEDGFAAIEDFIDALLRLQKAEDPSTVLDVELIGPDHTPETYVNDCHALITGARARLTGAQK